MESIIEQSILKAQQLHTDVFGFGNALYCAHPTIYSKRYRKGWNEVFFPKISVSLGIKPKVMSIGMTNNPPEDGQ